MPVSVYGMADKAKRHISEYSSPANFARIVISHVFAPINAAASEKLVHFLLIFHQKPLTLLYLIFGKFYQNILCCKRTARSVNWPCAWFAYCLCLPFG